MHFLLQLPLLCCFLLFPFVANCQSFSTDFQPARNYRPAKTEIKVISDKFKERAAACDSKDKKVKVHVKQVWAEKAEYCQQLDSIKLLMHNDALANYILKLTDRIQQSNPELKVIDTRMLLYRTESPNAASHGEGLFLVHLGLLERVRSEEELAFILCHELAHEYKKHVVTNIQARAEKFYNKEFQKELKKAGEQEFNSYKASVELLTQFQSNLLKFNRQEELEADSLGLIFFVNAGYNPNGAISAMNMLDSLDYPIYDEKINFTKYFGTDSKPFQETWLRADGSFIDLGYTIDKTYKIPDSLKTHPDCKLRIAALERISSKLPSDKIKVVQPLTNYAAMKERATFEMIEMYLQTGYYDRALHRAIQLREKYPDNIYLKCAVVHSMYEIYEAQTQHRFSQAVDFPDRDFSQQRNEFQQLLQNLSAGEMQSFASHFFKEEIEDPALTHPYAGYVETLLKSIGKEKTIQQHFASQYQKQYNDIYYKQLLDKKFNINKK